MRYRTCGSSPRQRLRLPAIFSSQWPRRRLLILPLTCPNAASIGQPQNNCSGLTYQQPTSDQLIVLRSNGTWARAVNLAGADTLAVCALPVQPGTYSGCKDASGVRRIVYLAKSQVFSSSPPSPPPPSGARTLDLSRTPVQITQQGVYVLNRNSSISEFAPPGGIIVITGNGVTLDLQGFELIVEGNTAIVSSGSGVDIRNGTVYAEGGTAIRTTGQHTHRARCCERELRNRGRLRRLWFNSHRINGRRWAKWHRCSRRRWHE